MWIVQVSKTESPAHRTLLPGAREGNRTLDLRITSALLCRLSYSGGLDFCRSATVLDYYLDYCNTARGATQPRRIAQAQEVPIRGTLTERSPGRWRLRVYIGRDPNGRPLQATRTVTGGKRAAEAALRKFITEVEHSRSPDRSITVATLLDRWLDHITLSRRPSTLDRYRRKIDNAINPALGGVRLDRLTAEILDRQYRSWLDSGLSPSTVHVYHAILSASLRQAVKWGWLDRSPAQQASPPPQARSHARSVLPEDLQRLLRAAEPDDPTLATAIALAALTGCRRGELCALRWADVDMAAGVLTVARSYTPVNGERHEGPTKTHQARRLALDPIAIQTLRRRWEFQQWYAAEVEVSLDANPYILSRDPRGSEPGHPDYLTHAFASLNKRLGLDYHLHELRHFTATTAIAAGADIRTVASRLGHADPSVTLRIYAHALEARDRELAAILGRTLQSQLHG